MIIVTAVPFAKMPYKQRNNKYMLCNVLSDYTRKSSTGLLPITVGVGSPWQWA